MLKKVNDEYANEAAGDALVDECVTSVTTGRTMAEIASGSDVWHSNRGRRGKAAERRRKSGQGPPPFQAPQLATLVDAVPTGPDWIHEYKYDGYRLLVATGDGAATAWTRNGKDWSDKFRALAKAAASLPAGCLIDGEAVALNAKGKPDFQLLQATLKEQKRRQPRFLRLRPAGRSRQGHQKAAQPRAQGAVGGAAQGVAPPILYGDHVIGKGEELFDAICKRGRRGHRLEERRRALSRRPHTQLAQGQMHPAAGVRHRRLVGKRQARAAFARCCSACAKAAS